MFRRKVARARGKWLYYSTLYSCVPKMEYWPRCTRRSSENACRMRRKHQRQHKGKGKEIPGSGHPLFSAHPCHHPTRGVPPFGESLVLSGSVQSEDVGAWRLAALVHIEDSIGQEPGHCVLHQSGIIPSIHCQLGTEGPSGVSCRVSPQIKGMKESNCLDFVMKGL